MSLARDNTPDPAPSTPDSTRSVMAKLEEYHKVRGDFATSYIVDHRDDSNVIADQDAAIAAAIASGRFPGPAVKKKKAADVDEEGKSSQDDAVSNHKSKKTQVKRPSPPVDPNFTRTTRNASRAGFAIVENYNSSSDEDAKLEATVKKVQTNRAAVADPDDTDADLAAMGISAARIEELNGAGSAYKAFGLAKAKPGKKKASPIGFSREAREAREELRADETVKRSMHDMLSADDHLDTDRERLVAAAQELQERFESDTEAPRRVKRKASAAKASVRVEGPASKKSDPVAPINVRPRRSKRKAAQVGDEEQAVIESPAVKKRKVTAKQTAALPNELAEDQLPATTAGNESDAVDGYVYPVKGSDNRKSKWSITPRLRAKGKQRTTETLVTRDNGSVSAAASDLGDSEFGDIHRRPLAQSQANSDQDDGEVHDDIAGDEAEPAAVQSTVVATTKQAVVATRPDAPAKQTVAKQTVAKQPVKRAARCKSTKPKSTKPVKVVKPETSTSVESKKSKVATKKRKRSDDDDDDQDEDADAPKAKKPRPGDVISRNWNGQPSGHGYSARPPPEAELDVPWQCGDRMCTSGMTWLKQVDDAGKEVSSVGRKVISHFFGRNKKCTQSIPKEVWHWYCRKHYQREKYANDHSKDETHEHQASAMFYLECIEHQVVRLENWRPHALFGIKLMTGAERRLAEWYRHLAGHNGNVQNAAASFPVAPITNNKPKPELHFPILSLVHLSDTFCGADKNYIDIRQMLVWVRGILNAGGSPAMAPFEILINDPWTIDGNKEPINDVKYSFQQWEAHTDGRPFDLAHAYQPGPGNPIPVSKPFKAPAPDHFEDVETASDPEGAAIRNCAKMGCRVSDGKGGVMVAPAKSNSKTSAKSKAAAKAGHADGDVQPADQADSNKRITRSRRANKNKK